MLPIDLTGKRALVAGVADDGGFGFAIAKALAIAGAKAWVGKRKAKGRTLVAIASGANTNFDRLRFVAEQAELGEHREAVLAVTIPERRGSFRRFSNVTYSVTPADRASSSVFS